MSNTQQIIEKSEYSKYANEPHGHILFARKKLRLTEEPYRTEENIRYASALDYEDNLYILTWNMVDPHEGYLANDLDDDNFHVKCLGNIFYTTEYSLLALNPHGSIDYKGKNLRIKHAPYLTIHDEYISIAVDSNDNQYEISWTITNPDCDDELDACDWDDYSVRPLNGNDE